MPRSSRATTNRSMTRLSRDLRRRGGRVRGRLLARLVGCLCALSLAHSDALGSSQDLFGLGARGAAMGGAVVSNAAGYPGVYYNPAALIALQHKQFTLGVQHADFSLQLNGGDYAVESVDNLLLGVNVPLPLGGPLGDRIAFGMGFVIPFASILEADVRAPESPVFIVVENRPRVIGLHAALAFRVTDWLLVGGGVVALAELLGGLDIAPNETGELGTEVRDELIADYAPIFGVLLRPASWLSVGVAFHGASAAQFTFPITAELGPDFPIDVPRLNIAGIAQYDPMQISAEVTIWPVEALQIAVGTTMKAWSDFENPIENTTETVPTQDPAGFKDIWLLRVGAEYEHDLTEVMLAYRLGTFFEPTPVLQQVANHNYLDSARVGVGVGVGLAWREITVDVGFQAQMMLQRTHTKDPDLVRDPENAGLPTITHGGNILLTVVELGLAF